jgi:3-oxoacyl-(acyl-carrier-protein) synthase
LTLKYDYLPSTVNLRNPDPECDLDYTSSGGRAKRVHTILSNSFGFGGINAALVFGRA